MVRTSMNLKKEESKSNLLDGGEIVSMKTIRTEEGEVKSIRVVKKKKKKKKKGGPGDLDNQE